MGAKTSKYPALRGVRVLDLSRVLAGPWATQLLADYGAEVWKVERPGVGDETRRWSPPSYSPTQAGAVGGESAYFMSTNRGKKSLAVDFSKPEGRQVVEELARHCDVVVENYQVGTLARYGLDYASLRLINPALIYCSITGFGQTGPERERPGFDYMMQAMGGLMSITGPAPGEPGSAPLRVGVPIADLMTGLYSTIAILAALQARSQHPQKEGQYLDMALFDVQLAMLANQAASYLATGQAPQRTGHQHPSIVPYQVFQAEDGPLVIAAGTDEQFRALCRVLGLPSLATDPRFASNHLRVESREVLLPHLTRQVAGVARNALLKSLQQAEVPCAPVNDIAQALASSQAKARASVKQGEHPQLGSYAYMANPIQVDGERPDSGLPPPRLGEHTRQILGSMLGLSEQRLNELTAGGVIASCLA